MKSNSLVSFPTHTDNYWDLWCRIRFFLVSLIHFTCPAPKRRWRISGTHCYIRSLSQSSDSRALPFPTRCESRENFKVMNDPISKPPTNLLIMVVPAEDSPLPSTVRALPQTLITEMWPDRLPAREPPLPLLAKLFTDYALGRAWRHISNLCEIVNLNM